MGYRLVVLYGYSALDHLGPELISLATGGNPERVFPTYAQAGQAVVRAAAALRRQFGPQAWPRVEIVREGGK